MFMDLAILASGITMCCILCAALWSVMLYYRSEAAGSKQLYNEMYFKWSEAIKSIHELERKLSEEKMECLDVSLDLMSQQNDYKRAKHTLDGIQQLLTEWNEQES